jgi:hypothetical protein
MQTIDILIIRRTSLDFLAIFDVFAYFNEQRIYATINILLHGEQHSRTRLSLL